MTAAELFLDDVSAEDYQETVADHLPSCGCRSCLVFARLLELERYYATWLGGGEVPEEVSGLCAEKDRRYRG